MLGILYIVATPIGNLGDITLRALETLKSVDLILAEDTRVTKNLLTKYAIATPTFSYHQQSRYDKKYEILKMLLDGKNLALVTDAGTPGISDPGNELIEFLVQSNPNLDIVPIPGPSSLTAALSVCGMDIANFLFLGFLPKKKRAKIYEKMKTAACPVVFFDSPYRIVKTLEELIAEFGEERKVFVAQELTKLHERTLWTTLFKAKEELTKEVQKAGRVRGEIVVIVS